MKLFNIFIFAIVVAFSFLFCGFMPYENNEPRQDNIAYVDQGPEVMTAARFKVYNHLHARIDNFDFDFKCEISSFRLVRVSQRNDPVIIENKGASFSAASQRIINMAKAGDLYFFENIRAKCAGDDVTRKLESVAFRIK